MSDLRESSKHLTFAGSSDLVLERLRDATRVIVPLQSEISLSQQIADSASTIFDAPGAAVLAIEGNSLILTAASGCCAALAPGICVAGNAAIRRAALTSTPTLATSIDDAPQGFQAHRPAFVVPVSLNERAIAIIWIRVLRPDAIDHSALDIFATQAAAALDNARRYRALAEASRMKDAEVATLAHELRNPLAAILNALRVLERLGAPDLRVIRLREIIGRQAKHLSRLVEDTLDILRFRHGKFQLQRRPIDLREVVRQALEALHAAGRCTSHKIQETYSTGPVVVDGDATRLDQVVRNLLDNALKYSPAWTAIDVSVEREDTTATFRVRDNGIGIGPELLPSLFEPFAQAAPGGHQTAGGLGIGLPLVRAIVEAHGGTVNAHSEGAGMGSEFTVRLPLALSAL